jgi:polysaccharide chain length determinant protein (PEP-CTERM system associated)
MSVLVQNLTDELRGAWRFWKPALIAAWLLALGGWVAVLAMGQEYEATARVFVNTSTALRPLLQGLTVEDDVDAQLAMVREELLGRDRLEKVIREADLAVDTVTPGQKEKLLADLQKDVVVEALTPGTRRGAARSGDSVYAISYRHHDREKALAVVRTVVDSFMEDTLTGKRTGADTAQAFLSTQIAEYGRRLSSAENRLAEFKKQNVGLVPGEQGDYFSRLQAEIALAKQAESKLAVALRRREELARQLGGEMQYRVSGAVGSSADGSSTAVGRGGNDTLSRIAETQANLDDLRLKFTERHPEVRALEETLKELKARHQAELDALKRGDTSAAASAGLATNPVYQSLQLQLNQANVEIAALRGELGDHRSSEAELRKLVNTAPEVEAEFARLTRDYDVEKAQYTALVERLEKAKLAENAADTGIVEFRIINPPNVPLKPSSPSRKLLTLAVFVAAIVASLGLAVVLSRLKPVYDSTRALADDTGMPCTGCAWRCSRLR